MSTDAADARADLAFMRGLLAQNSSGLTAALGEAYFAGGLLYGLQCVLQSLPLYAALPPLGQLIGGFGPTVVFCAALSVIIWRHRANSPTGLMGRAVGAVFGCLSLSNLVLVCVIGSLALRRRDFEIWLIYPCTVFVMQGATWLVAAALRRRSWMLAVALGWFVASIALALSIPSLALFPIIAGVSLLGLMAAPGLAIMRLARQAG